MTATSPLHRDSRGNLLRARTFSATAIHTPHPDDIDRTLCGGTVRLTSEWACEAEARGETCNYTNQHNDNGLHEADLTICAGADPQLCKRCEQSVAKRLAQGA